MPSFKAPTGDTTASRIKTLVIHVERLHGRAEVDDFLAEVGIGRDLVVDETRPVSVAMWRKALEQFARRYGTTEIERTSPDVVHTGNLGPWIHVVRNADSVVDAYRLIEGGSTNLTTTTRIETVRSGDGFWVGRLHVLHDPSLERGGLLAAARRAELAAVPTLFGLPEADVRETASLERGDAYYEYEARWPDPRMSVTLRVLAVLVATSVFAGVGLAAFKVPGLMVMSLMGLVAGLLGLRLYEGERLRRIQVHSQSMRIRALERSLELQEAPDTRHALGDLDGQVIAGLYRLHARLGAGATGVIYEALRLSDRAPVAVKLLRAAVAEDTVAADRLRREAEALRLTWHPNVVELYDHGHLPDGSSYLVMELLRGETLAMRLSRQRRLSSAEMLPIVEQICEALSAMHAAGVIHRDLKPSNIYLCEKTDLRSSNNWIPRDPTAPRVKIFDFGIARVEWAETRITNMGTPLGTPGYMAPEQEAGETVDLRCDVYALGAVIYECLSGNPPPLRARALTEGGSSQPPRWQVQQTTGSTGPAPQVDERWRAIVDKAMSPKPDDRYQDARSVAAAVHALLSEPNPTEPTTAESDSGTIPKASRSA